MKEKWENIFSYLIISSTFASDLKKVRHLMIDTGFKLDYMAIRLLECKHSTEYRY